MTFHSCEFEEQIVRGRGGAETPELTEHLAQCQSCRQVAAIVFDMETRVSGLLPGHGFKDEAQRLWHVSRLSNAVVDREPMRRKVLLIQALTVVVPLVIVAFLLRRRLVSSGLVEAVPILQDSLAGAADWLATDVATVVAGALLLVTAVAVTRLALSD